MNEQQQQQRETFDAWIARHARGTLNDEASIALSEVVAYVATVGKAGKLIIELKIEPAGSGGRTVAIGGTVTTKVPRPDPELGIFYVGLGGSLHRDDPYAQRLPGIPYTDTAGQPHIVDPGTGEVRRLDDPATAEPIRADQPAPEEEETHGPDTTN